MSIVVDQCYSRELLHKMCHQYQLSVTRWVTCAGLADWEDDDTGGDEASSQAEYLDSLKKSNTAAGSNNANTITSSSSSNVAASADSSNNVYSNTGAGSSSNSLPATLALHLREITLKLFGLTHFITFCSFRATVVVCLCTKVIMLRYVLV